MPSQRKILGDMEENKEECSKIVWHDMKDVGKTHRSKCTKPVYRDGLCKKHYTNFRRKTTPWGERKEYRVITLAEMQRGKHFKLRYSHQHRMFRMRTGVIQEYKTSDDDWHDTELEIDPEKYCVKIY
jgi:hypothetical protein